MYTNTHLFSDAGILFTTITAFRLFLRLPRPKLSRILLLIVSCVGISFAAHMFTHYFVSYFLGFIFTLGLFPLLLVTYHRTSSETLLVLMLSFGISLILYFMAAIPGTFLQSFLRRFSKDGTEYLYFVGAFIGILTVVFVLLLFRLPRLRKGLPYLRAKGLDIVGALLGFLFLVTFSILQGIVPASIGMDPDIPLTPETLAESLKTLEATQHTTSLSIASLIVYLILGFIVFAWIFSRTTREYRERIRAREMQHLTEDLHRQMAENDRLSSLLHRDNKLLLGMQLAVGEVLDDLSAYANPAPKSSNSAPANAGSSAAKDASSAKTPGSENVGFQAEDTAVSAKTPSPANAASLAAKDASSAKTPGSENVGFQAADTDVSAKTPSPANAASLAAKDASSAKTPGSENVGFQAEDTAVSAKNSGSTDSLFTIEDKAAPGRNPVSSGEDLPDLTALASRAAVLREELDGLAAERSGTVRRYELETLPLPKTGIPSADTQLAYMQKRAAGEGIFLDFSSDGSVKQFVPEKLEETELVTLLADLLENALHATVAAGGDRIFLFIGLRDGVFGIEVSDTGVPFPPSVIEAYGKRRKTTRKDEGGTGIGLMTIHDILKKQGGSFHVKTLPENAPYKKTLSVRFDRGKDSFE